MGFACAFNTMSEVFSRESIAVFNDDEASMPTHPFPVVPNRWDLFRRLAFGREQLAYATDPAAFPIPDRKAITDMSRPVTALENSIRARRLLSKSPRTRG